VKILIINGPNLNKLGKRSPEIYGPKSLNEIQSDLDKLSKNLGVELEFYQSNTEGSIVDFIQSNSSKAHGLIINPGALTHYGLSLADALMDLQIPIVEVHLSNIYKREEWRKKSVVAPTSIGQISGLGAMGYSFALQFLCEYIKSGGPS